jgi:16S rRNA (guanine966-N2)-methyltransferase
MRIIGGEHRGLKLATPRGREVRPILDRVRESLFGVLRHEVPEARVADVFAGTGVIGLEAVSRGAERCVFVERDPRCLATIRENITRCRGETATHVLQADAFRSDGLLAEHGPFSLVFLDPPYRLLRSERNFAKVTRLVERFGAPDLLEGEGTLVLRFPADVTVPGHVGPLTQFDRRRYGGMRIALYRHTDPA